MLSAAIRRIVFLITVAGLLSGCAGYPQFKPFFGNNTTIPVAEPAEKLEKPPANKPRSFWEDDKTKGAPQIVVKLGEQRAYFYRGKKVVGATHISTGKTGFSTPAGSYRITQKDKDHVSTLYGDFVGDGGSVVKANVDTSKDHPPAGAAFRGAKMPYFLRFRDGIGMHSGKVPNYPASHGCVRLPAEMAKHFFDAAEIGTPVRVED